MRPAMKRLTLIAVLCLLPIVSKSGEFATHETSPVKVFWSGAVTSTSAKINMVVRVRHLPVTLRVGTSKNLKDAVFKKTFHIDDITLDEEGTSDPKGRELNARMISVPVKGLTPNTPYFYWLGSPKSKLISKAGRFKTFPDGAASFSFATGSCASTGSKNKVFEVIRNQKPLFYLHLGDLHYSNISLNSAFLYRNAYEKVLDSAVQAKLYRYVPIAYVWDDHDYGSNNSNMESPAREAARRVYQEYVPHYSLVAGKGDVPIYQAFTVGRTRFILTDTRSEKTPASKLDTPEKSVLGTVQKAWFKEEVLRASRSHAVVFWGNTIPWIGAPDAGSDSWEGYNHERAELATFFAENGIDNLIILSGDAHMVALDDGTNSQYADVDALGPVVFHAAALDRGGSIKGGPYSHGAFPGSSQYGWVDVKDDGASVLVRFSGRKADGTELVSYEKHYAKSRGPASDETQ